jgi:hypothetical protein
VLSASTRLDGPPVRSAQVAPAWPSPFSGIAADEADSDPEPISLVAGPCALAAHRVERSSRADLDPATFLRSDCCADGAACAPGADPSPDRELWPALVLGRPGARWTEPGGPPVRSAVEALVDVALEVGAQLGCRSLLAPWCVDRGAGALLHSALAARGAAVQRRSYAHAIDLRDRGVDGFTSSLPRPVQDRRHRDASAVQAAGHRVAVIAPGEWERHRPAVEQLAAELAAGGALAPDHAGPPPPVHLGENEHAFAVFHGEELRAFAVFVRAGDTLWLAARGLARDARGFPAALLFHLLLHEVPAAAGASGVTRIEYGTSAAGAWVLRGCDATAVYGGALPIGAPA